MDTTTRQSPRPATWLLLAPLALAYFSGPETALAGPKPGPWSPPEVAMRSDGQPVTGGCPHESPNGKFLYTASAADGTLDVWVYGRERGSGEFTGPDKIPEPISLDDIGGVPISDFCPTPFRNTVLYFVSTRGTCGMGDIFVSHWHPALGWLEPEELGCGDEGPNTPGGEFSPSLVRTSEGLFLYYSSDGTGNHDIYRSKRVNGVFGPGEPVAELNSEYDDRMPNINWSGLEIVFSSARPSPGESNPTQDVFVATRPNDKAKWSKITNLSETVPFSTVDADETRVTISRDRKRLYYGSGGTIYTSSRAVK